MRFAWAAFMAAFLLFAPGHAQDVRGTSIGLGAGLTAGGYNPGTQKATAGAVINSQLVYKGEATSCTVNSSCSSFTNNGADSGYLITFTAPGQTGTIPASGPPGSATYSFGYDGTDSYSITSSSTIHSCGTAGTTISGIATQETFVPEGSQWQCVPSGGGSPGSGASTNPTVAQDTNVPYQSSGCTSGCSFTIPATVAGYALAIPLGTFANTSVQTYTITDGGDTCAAAAGANSGNAGASAAPYINWYICPNVAGGRTSVTITSSGTIGFAGEIYQAENVATSGTIYEGGNGGTGSNVVAFSLSGTTSFANDLILLAAWGGAGSSAISATGGTWVPGVSGIALTQQGTGTGTYGGNLTATGATTSSYAELAIKP